MHPYNPPPKHVSLIWVHPMKETNITTKCGTTTADETMLVYGGFYLTKKGLPIAIFRRLCKEINFDQNLN